MMRKATPLHSRKWRHLQLENVATDDVLPLKAVRHDAISNLKCFWGMEYQRPNFDGFIYIHYVVPPYSTRISTIYLLPFGKVWWSRLPCATHDNEAERRIYRGWVKTPLPFQPVCGPKFTKFSDDVGDRSYVSDYLFDVSFRGYASLNLKVPENPNKCKSFGPNFWEWRPLLFYDRLLARCTVHCWAKFSWVLFADLRVRSLAMN